MKGAVYICVVVVMSTLSVNSIAAIYHYGDDPHFCSEKAEYVKMWNGEYGDESHFLDIAIQCEEDGSFTPKQCFPNGLCFCATPFGNWIARTLTPANKELPICEGLRAGQCPRGSEISSCDDPCQSDADCSSNFKCCHGDCGKTCVSPVQECLVDEIACSDGLTCVNKMYICDGYPDCPDEDDENQCACGERRFQCALWGHKIPLSKRCNGGKDCLDGSDEENCEDFEEPCDLVNRFMCRDGSCIDRNNVCDGYNDCADGGDEWNCVMFVCGDGSEISLTSVCDSFPDCEDKSDEINCKYPPNCPSDIFSPCDNGECVAAHQFCDGAPDCEDGSDEQNC